MPESIMELGNYERIIAKVQESAKKIKELPTPETAKYTKGGSNATYVKLPYMLEMMDMIYPIWSWEIKDRETFTIEIDGKTIPRYFIVHGRLTFMDNGVSRVIEAVAGHRIQYLQDKSDFSDVGNDVKATNTDCMKKALSMIGIASDVYTGGTSQKPEESGVEEVKQLFVKAGKDPTNFLTKVEAGSITKNDIENLKAQLTVFIEQQNS